MVFLGCMLKFDISLVRLKLEGKNFIMKGALKIPQGFIKAQNIGGIA